MILRFDFIAAVYVYQQVDEYFIYITVSWLLQILSFFFNS